MSSVETFIADSSYLPCSFTVRHSHLDFQFSIADNIINILVVVTEKKIYNEDRELRSTFSEIEPDNEMNHVRRIYFQISR